MRRSLGALIDRSILREEGSGNGIRMRFEDPFFAQWIRLFDSSRAGRIFWQYTDLLKKPNILVRRKAKAKLSNPVDGPTRAALLRQDAHWARIRIEKSPEFQQVLDAKIWLDE